MQINHKIQARSVLLIAAVFSLTLVTFLGMLKTPARAAAHSALQATATPAAGNTNACGVVINTDFITPTVTVTATTITAEPTATAEPTTAVTSTETVSPTERMADEGKVLRIGEDIYPAVLDPQHVSYVNEFEIVELAYEGLTRVNATGQIEPAAAQSYAFSADGKTLTFTLRPGLKRVDGTPITAHDFEAGLQRALDPCLGRSQYSALLNEIQGAQELSDFDVDTHTPADLQNVMDNLGIDVPNDNTLVLTFAEPAGDFWGYVASLPIFYPVDTKLAAANPLGWSEIAGSHNGNGPFVILDLNPDSSITLVANPNYWRGKPKLDKIVFTYNPDNQAQLDAYKKGDLDIDATMSPELVPQVISSTIANDTIASELKEYEAAQTFALAFNNTVPPFTDRVVRSAFSQALDREGFVKDILLGHAETTTRWIPPGVPGSRPDKPGVPASDPGAAVKTLVDNGYGKDGKVDCDKLGEVKFTYPDSPLNKLRVEYISKNLTAVLGCEIKADPVAPIEFTRLTNDVKTNPQLSLQRWVGDYPSPQNWLSTYWTCGSFARDFGYCNVYLDELLRKADGTTDLEAAIKLYQQGEDLLIQDVPGAFMYNPHVMYLIKPNVAGPAQNTGPLDGGWIGQYGPVWQYDIATGGASNKAPAPGGDTSSSAPAKAPAQPVAATEVIEYAPKLPPDPAYKGSCFTTSITVQRAGAYRCSTDESVASQGGANLFDPCFVLAGDTKYLACVPDPIKGTPGIKLELTAALPTETPAPASDSSAWLVELADGTVCGFATGATFGVNDMRANYACTDQSWLFGDLKPGAVWTALRATITGQPPDVKFATEETAQIRRVWR